MPSFEGNSDIVLLNELGRGLQGVVWRATVTRRDGRRVDCAVKLPGPNWEGSKNEIRRFHREGAVLARISHPAFPEVLESGMRDGRPYLVVEYIEGRTLRQRIVDGARLSEADVWAAGRELIAGLEWAHAQGAVHCDVRPDNIVFDVIANRTRLVDFGLARSYAQDARRAAREWRDFVALGEALFEGVTLEPVNPQTDASARRSQLQSRSLSPACCDFLLSLMTEPMSRRLTPRPDTLPFVGRVAETEALLAVTVESAQAARTAVIWGAPGSGKTRLIETFFQGREHLPPTYVLSCRSWAPSAFSTIRDLAERILTPVTDAQRLKDLAGDTAPLLRALSPKLNEMFDSAGRIPNVEDTRAIYIEGLSQFLVQALGDMDRCFIVIEDIQWMDTSSRQVIQRVIDRVADLPCLFILTARDSVEDRAHASRLLSKIREHVRCELQLKGLSEPEVGMLVQGYLGSLPLLVEDQRRVAPLVDGNPLRVMEVARSLLEEGLLSPRWGRWSLDHEGIGHIGLPKSTSAMLERRLASLDVEVLEILRAGAVLGSSFDGGWALRLACSERPSLLDHLPELSEGVVVRTDVRHVYRFLHETLRETLLSALSPDVRKALHLRATEDLQSQAERSEDPDTLYQLAYHASMSAEASWTHCHTANVKAGIRAFQDFDNEHAIGFLSKAEQARTELGLPNDPEVSQMLADGHWRKGDITQSLDLYKEQLERATDPIDKAALHCRVAWIHELRFEAKLALDHMAQGHSNLGLQPRHIGPMTIVRLLASASRTPRTKTPPNLTDEQRRRLRLEAHLHYQTARLCVHSSRPSDLFEAVFSCVRAAEQLGPSIELCKAYLMQGFLLVAMNQKRRGLQWVALAKQIAGELNDSIAIAHCLNVGSVIRTWAGDFEVALNEGSECLLKWGHWMYFAEYCGLCINQSIIESLRGRDLEAWKWARLMLSRAEQYEGEPVLQYAVYAHAHACAAAVRQVGSFADLFEKAGSRSISPSRDALFYVLDYGPMIRRLLEVGELGREFEDIVRDFKEGKHNPKRVHRAVTEYYVCVAYGRVQQCLSADADRLPGYLEELRHASRELDLAACAPLFVAHASTIRGFLAYLQNKPAKAEKLFRRAEELGIAEAAPAIYYWVARGRARLLRDEGHARAAIDQARIAESVARTNGSVGKAAWIRSEFGLASSTESDGSQRRTNRTSSGDDRRSLLQNQVQALVEVSRTTTSDSSPEQHARFALDEAVATLHASRGFVMLRASSPVHSPPHSPQDWTLTIGRDATGGDLPKMTAAEGIVADEAVLARRTIVRSGTPKDAHVLPSLIAVPLLVQDQVLGVVCLTSAPHRAAFDPAEGELLHALAVHVPLAIELSRAFRDRELLADDLRHAQKMEAMGRLAGGIAHDFNNMLAAIQVSVESALSEAGDDSRFREDLTTIQSASDRASKLTRQLLAFSRRQVLDARPLDLNTAVRGLMPMLQRLLGEDVAVRMDLQPAGALVRADVNQMEQALVNLCVNARDAMPEGGTLTLTTRTVEVADMDPSGRAPGHYIALTVADNGHGMDRETQARAFEPFFTTKGEERGSGLGLAMVYGFTKQSGGTIHLKSELGRGSEFTLFLPVTSEEVSGARLAIPAERNVSGSETILLVEDEVLVRQSLARILRNLGYVVMTASDGDEALRLAARDSGIDLVVTDVIMPGMNGVELVEELQRRGITTKVLYVSGFTDGVLAEKVKLGQGCEFLEKPLSHSVFARTVRALLDEKPRREQAQQVMGAE